MELTMFVKAGGPFFFYMVETSSIDLLDESCYLIPVIIIIIIIAKPSD